MRKCKLCLEQGICCDVGQYCISCGESYSLCNSEGRNFFHEHLKRIRRITRATKKNTGFLLDNGVVIKYHT